MLPKKFASALAIAAVIFSILACSAEPAQPQPEPVEPLGGAPSVPQPTATLRPPTRTSTPRPTPTKTQPPAAPPKVNLPPLPDFEGSIVASGMGGGPRCDDQYQGPPHVQGAANSFVPARTGYLCLYGIGFDSGFRVELTAPDNSITLGGNYYVSSQDFDIYWNDMGLRNFGSYANWLGGSPPGDFFLIGEAYTRIYINIRWRGDLPTGYWRFRVAAENGMEVVEDFLVVAPNYPSITVVDSRQDWILPAYSNCHFANQPQDLFALAEGYPPNRDVYLYVYEQYDGLVLQSTVRTNSYGSFFTAIRGPYRQDGRYFLIGSPEPLSSANIPQGNNMVDCFYVP